MREGDRKKLGKGGKGNNKNWGKEEKQFERGENKREVEGNKNKGGGGGRIEGEEKNKRIN